MPETAPNLNKEIIILPDEGWENISYEEAADRLIGAFYRFMDEKSRTEGRIYHTREFHIEKLQKRAQRLADIFKLLPQQRKSLEMDTAVHDTIMKKYPMQNPSNIAERARRMRGARVGDKPAGLEGNEARSAWLLADAKREVNQRAGREVFDEENIETGTFAVDVTCPGFEPAAFKSYPFYEHVALNNPRIREVVEMLEKLGITQGPLFSQPHLEEALQVGEKIPREVLIMALIDLGGAGYEDEKGFFEEGDHENWELLDKVFLPENITRLFQGTQDADAADRAKVAEAGKDWLRSQVPFVVLQWMRFEKIIYLLEENDQLSREEERLLRQEFPFYEKNVWATHSRAKGLVKKYDTEKEKGGEQAAFMALVKSMHFPVRAISQ